MSFLRWIGGFIVLFWILGLLFRIGGAFINIMLIIAAIVFVSDLVLGRKKDL
jgi:hypothetical protein